MKKDKKVIRAYRAEDINEIINYIHSFPKRSYIDNPYLRHFERLVEFGKPPGQYQVIQLKYYSKIYLLGTIVFSQGYRTLFFPGFSKLSIPHPMTNKFHEIHHITCEKSLKNGHLKFRNRKIKFPDFLTKKENICYFWFGLSIDKPDVLFNRYKHRELIKFPKEIKSDINRRLKLINDFYRTGFGFNIGEITINQDEFLNFEFFLTKSSNFDNSDFLKIPIASSDADFKEGKDYPSMFNSITDVNSDRCIIIRFSILPKNTKNSLNLNKSSLFFNYVKPF